MAKARALRPRQLARRVNPNSLGFKTTDDLDAFDGVLGQPRAVQAVQFGIGIEAEGYNIFAIGPSGTGKYSLLQDFFRARAAEKDIPADWCYVNNFEQPHKPRALEFAAGEGSAFAKDMDRLVDDLQTALETTFESEDYHSRRQEIQESVQSEQEQALEQVREQAENEGFTLLRTPAGLGFAPVRDGEVVEPDAYKNLSKEERESIESKVTELQNELQRVMRHLPRLQREAQEMLRQLNREMATLAAGGLIEDLQAKYSEHEGVAEYLAEVETDVLENVRGFLPQESHEGMVGPEALFGAIGDHTEPQLRRYKVNVIVDHSDSEHGPLVTEDNPTLTNLVGRVEHVPQMGALLTDFNLIKSGALHRANGGYLLLDARKVLLQPFAWESLKRALRAGEIRVESPMETYGLISTVSLEPEPIPLKVKVALVGDRMLYYLLASADPEFSPLFKVMADFDDSMEWDAAAQKDYARLLARLIEKESLRPFGADAIARVLERSARIVGDSDKLSSRMRMVTDLLREADYWAGENGHKVATADDVNRAIEAHTYRADRLRQRSNEAILRQTILIDTEGEAVGQVNGLAVLQLGDFAFGRPSRITARVRLGSGQVVDIEREAELGGSLHSKGVMILAGYLGATYARDEPLSLAASLTFEQSYGGVEGDSASSAELYALLSAIADVPLKQSLAVTGSVNQAGEVQAIGGVNEKIEGFFDICVRRGLTGEQGVLIPVSNVKHLMLREDVVEAVSAGEFHIYPVTNIDQGLELLSGLRTGSRRKDGSYTPDSFNGKVQESLREFAEQRRAFHRDHQGAAEP